MASSSAGIKPAASGVSELSSRPEREDDHESDKKTDDKSSVHDDASFPSLSLKLKGDFRPRRSLAKADIYHTGTLKSTLS